MDIIPIIIMPPQLIIIGMPLPIMLITFWQHCMNMSFIAGSIGAISQVIMPAGDIVQVILHIIIGIAMPGMPIIDMPAIIGFIIIGFIIPGIPPIIGMGMGIDIGIMGIICIAVFMVLSIAWDEFASSVGLKSRIASLFTQ